MLRSIKSGIAVVFACAFALHAPVHAQGPAETYPGKPVRFIVAFAPGGATDVLARLVANQLSQTMGQPFVVENRAGGGGVVAVQAVLSAPADGHTVLVGGSGPMVFNPIVSAKLPYKPEDITPVTILGSYPIVVATKNSLPAKSFREVVQMAKAKPGAVSYGHPSASFQVPFDYLSMKLGIKMLPVQYRGAGPAAQGLMSGDTDLLVSDTATIAPMHKAGTARAVAVTTKRRNTALPDVPTVAESGMPGFEASAFAALGVHHATPAAIVTKLQRAVASALSTPQIRERLDALGIEAGGNSPADAAARIKHEIETYTPVAEAAGLKGTQ